MNVGDNSSFGFDGIEFVELTTPEPERMVATLEQFGFVAASRHRQRDIVRYKQGRINLLLNRSPSGHAATYRKAHGPSACGYGFCVASAADAFERAVARGAKPVNAADSALGARAKVLESGSGAFLYLVDRGRGGSSIFDEWEPVPGALEAEAKNSVGFERVDHLTTNMGLGHMRPFFALYQRIFGFKEQRYFVTQGQHTGMANLAMVTPDKSICMALSEGLEEESQVSEFVRQFRGDGVQHVALATGDIYTTVERLRARGVKFQATSKSYYEQVVKRIPNHGEDLPRLERNEILLDGDPNEAGLLLQIFTQTLFGPVFFEIIQRKGNEGFGDGNAQALFESIERDQVRRGVIKGTTPA